MHGDAHGVPGLLLDNHDIRVVVETLPKRLFLFIEVRPQLPLILLASLHMLSQRSQLLLVDQTQQVRFRLVGGLRGVVGVGCLGAGDRGTGWLKVLQIGLVTEVQVLL